MAVSAGTPAGADDLCFMPATAMAAAYRRRELSPVEVVDAVLDRIERCNPQVNAFVTLVAEQAREQAQAAEQLLTARSPEELPALHGIPLTVKDLTPTAGVRTTFGHPLFAEHVPDEDGVIWARLKQAGAILLGKTTTPPFGSNSVTESDVSGITNNPWDRSRTVGGSSGGAAAAVVAGFGPLATGSDGGGSIRVPASLCGAVGLKPSSGRIPNLGDEGTMETVGVVGPITRTVADNALMLGVVAGPHPYEPFSLLETGVDYLAGLEGASLRGLKVAYSPDLGQPPVAPDVRAVVERAVGLIERGMGAHVEQVELSLPDPVQYFMDWWGPYAALSVADMPDLAEDFLKRSTGERYLRHGQQMTAADVMRVQHQTRDELHRAFADVFLAHDLLVWPTTTTTAFPHPGEAGGPTVVDGQPVAVPSLENQRFTEAISHACYPAITVPAGFTEEGLPVGLQIAAGHGQDLAVLRGAAAFEAAQPWADRRPAL